jgi:four helix bundle protein
MPPKIQSYKDLIVWQKSMDLVVCLYGITAKFPRQEIYGLTSQINRCAVSIPSNIAEGSKRKSQKERERFYTISYGSGAELETQLEIARRLSLVDKKELAVSTALLDEVMRMLNIMIHY